MKIKMWVVYLGSMQPTGMDNGDMSNEIRVLQETGSRHEFFHYFEFIKQNSKH